MSLTNEQGSSNREDNTMTGMMRNIKEKCRTYANNSGWVSELLAADCKERAWLHPEWEDNVQRWCSWLQDMNKNDEEEEHQTLVSRMITGADGGAGLLHKITMPTAWRGGVCWKRWKEMPSPSRHVR